MQEMAWPQTKSHTYNFFPNNNNNNNNNNNSDNILQIQKQMT